MNNAGIYDDTGGTRMILKSLSSLVLLIPLCSAEAFEDISKIKTESETAARNIAPKLNEYFSGEKYSELNKITGYSPNTLIPGQDMKLDQAEGMGHATRQQEYKEQKDYHCSKEKCEVGHTFSTHATLGRQVKAEVTGFIKDENGEVKNNKGYMDKALETVRNSKKNFDFLKGEYVDCEAGKELTTFDTKENCDQYFDIKKNGCFAAQTVEIDPKYTYVCNKRRDIKEKFCTTVLKELKCQKTKECGGSIIDSFKSEMEWSYNFPILTLGRVGHDYWHGRCAAFDKLSSFRVINKADIKEFKILDVSFDDYIWIKINDTTIYVGPDGGNQISVVNGRAVTNGHAVRICERDRSHKSLDIDLKEYLKDEKETKDGENTIWIRLIVSIAGDTWMNFSIKQDCCDKWDETWENICEWY